MQKELKDLHNNMIDLFATSDKELSFVNNKKNFNQKVAKTIGIANQYKSYAVAYRINKDDIDKDAEKEIQELLNKEFDYLTLAMKDIGFDEQTNEYKKIKDVHDNVLKKESVEFEVSMLTEVFKRKSFEILNSSVDKKIEDYSKRYQNLVKDFKESGNSGWYDYFGEYSFHNSLNQKQKFVDAINELKESGMDIELVVDFDVKSSKEGVVSVLTNSANVETLHDVIYQDLNPKNVIISGSFMLPKFGKETDLSFTKDSLSIDNNNDYNQFKKSGEKNKSTPKPLEDQYYSKGDAFAITKGKPVNALFCSRLPEEFINRDLIRNKAHFFNGSPSKDAVKIQNKEQNKRRNTP